MVAFYVSFYWATHIQTKSCMWNTHLYEIPSCLRTPYLLCLISCVRGHLYLLCLYCTAPVSSVHLPCSIKCQHCTKENTQERAKEFTKLVLSSCLVLLYSIKFSMSKSNRTTTQEKLAKDAILQKPA